MKKNKVYETKYMIQNAKALKKNELYDSMIYWSQKSYNICDILIENFTKKGDIVFDPFLGSGVTLFQAIKKNMGRNAIGCEINDEPIFLINTLLKKRNIKAARKDLIRFKDDLSSLDHYYEIICPNCKERGVVKNTVFDIVENGTKQIKKCTILCKCNIKSTNNLTDEMLDKMEIDLHLNHIEDITLIPNSKIAVKENQHISSIFTNRNMVVLDSIIELKSKYEQIEDLIDYVLLSMLHLCKITDTHSNSQWPLWIPSKNCVEKNILIIMRKKISQLLKTLDFVNKEYKLTEKKEINEFRNNNYAIINKGIQNITTQDIPDNSVDLVITDPPYLGQVTYSEYMQLYKPFLGLNINFEDEIVVSTASSRNKSVKEYFNLIDKAFHVISKKAKPNSFLCLYFHDSKLQVWAKLIDILNSCSYYYVSQVHINKTNTVKNILSPKKSMNGDCILFFVKDPDNLHKFKSLNKTEQIDVIEHSIVKEAKYQLANKEYLSTTELYDGGIMEMLIQNNWLPSLSKRYNSLVDIFEKYFTWDSEKCAWRNQSMINSALEI